MVEVVMVQDESVSTEDPRAGGPRRRWVFTVAEKIEHLAALRQLANRLVGIQYGCRKTGTPYDEHTAWPHQIPVTRTAAV